MSTPQQFIDINIGLVEKIEGKLMFDVYVKRGSHYTRLFPKGDDVDLERILQYKQQKGLQTFSVTKAEYELYRAYIEKIAALAFAPNSTATPDDVVAVLGEMVQTAMSDALMQTPLEESDIIAAGTTVMGCIKALSQDKKKFVDIFKMLARQPIGIRHSLSCCLFSIILAKLVGMGSEKTLMTVGLGALLHDIGMSQLPYEAEEFDNMTATQLKEIKEHPQLGKKILDSVRSISPEVVQIVLQHHEQPNGMGYPNHLGGPQIYPPAKIVAIADAFVTLTTKTALYQEPFPPLIALQRMRDDINKFDTVLLRAFIDTFIRVKPS